VAEYVALVFVLVGLMLYLINLAFSLSDNYDPLKMFLILVSMFFGAISLHLGKGIAIENGSTALIQNSMDIAFWAWVTLTSLTIMYFGIYIIIRAYNSIADKKKLKLYDEENR